MNGLPAITSDEDEFEPFGDVASGVGYPAAESRRSLTDLRSSYVPWIAAGAVVAGAVGAVVGCMRQSSRSRARSARSSRPLSSADSRGLTSPHGDKLLPRH